jgi:hypothetical protein
MSVADLKELQNEHIHGNSFSASELTGMVLSGLPESARGHKVAVDTSSCNQEMHLHLQGNMDEAISSPSTSIS